MTDEERKAWRHQISVLRGKIAHKTGKEKEEAIRAYQEAGRAFTRAICAEGHRGDLTGNLPITSRLRYHCATRAAPLPALVT